MAFDIGTHLAEMVAGNVWAGGPVLTERPAQVRLPNGQMVDSAIPNHPESVTYWLLDGSQYQQISHDQAFVQNLWLHFAYDAPMPNPADDPIMISQGLVTGYHLSTEALTAAVYSMPAVLAHIIEGNYSAQEVLDYAHSVAPEIVAVGVAG